MAAEALIPTSPDEAASLFGEGKDLLLGFMEGVFGFDPAHLVPGEVFGQERGGVDFDEGKNSAHRGDF